LFENLHDRGRRAGLGLGDEQMNVLRHHHVTDERELIDLANFIEDFQKHVAAARRAEKPSSAIATTGNEMQVPLAIAALRFFMHRLLTLGR